MKSNERNSEKFKIASHEAFHKSLELLLEPILTLRNDIELTLENELICFYPQISVIISDWPEVATYCLIYKSTILNFSYHFYLVTRENLAKINLTTNEIELRTYENMWSCLNQNLEKSVCIKSLYNYF